MLRPDTVEQMVDACRRSLIEGFERVQVVPTSQGMLDLCCRLLALEAVWDG